MKWTTRVLAGAAALLMSACGVHQSEVPSLTGPSELALSVSMSASPDTISQDGRSNSTITLTARDVSGSAVSGMSFRVDMMVDSQIGDYGTLAARNVTTGSDGRATVVYTAPAPPPVGSTIATCSGGAASLPTPGHCVQIVATNAGTNYAGAATHTVMLHLTPTGVIIPPSSIPFPDFSVVPDPPAANAPALFDGSKSCAGQPDASGQCTATGTIVSYAWNFGDGGTGAGLRASHTYTKQGTFAVTLTIVNDLGITVTSPAHYVTIGAGAAPTASFTFSPTGPAPNQQVNFDANLSKPGAGHTIVRFVWNWGDGSTFTDTGSPITNHTFAKVGSYVVALTVSDETGQNATGTLTVNIGILVPTAAFVYSPSAPAPGDTIYFDGSPSKVQQGHTIVSYTWNYGDGTTATFSSPIGAQHSYGAGTWTVTLSVTDDGGSTGVASQAVKVAVPGP